MPYLSLRIALLTSCLLVIACGGADNGVGPCDLWTSSAVIEGHVTHSSGAAVVGAAIDIQVAMSGPCPQAGQWTHSKQDTTDANGNYLAEVRLGNMRGMRCVSVAEVGSGTSARGEVEFVGGCADTRSPRQMHLDLVIP